MFLLVLATAFVAAYLAYSIENHRRERVRADVSRQGWRIIERNPFRLKPKMHDVSVTYETPESPLTLERIQPLFGFRSFKSIVCSGTTIDSSAFAMLVSLHPERLQVVDMNVDDEMMKQLKNCKVKELDLSTTPISDFGLAYLKSNQFIESLSLDSTCVTDESVDTIISLVNLSTLDIDRTSVTWKGLQRIVESSSVQTIYCSELVITQETKEVASRKGIKLNYSVSSNGKKVRMVVDENGDNRIEEVCTE